MSSKAVILAKLSCDPAKADDLESALGQMCEAANEEAGLEIYSVHKNPNEPGIYWFFELYTDQDAVAVHGKGDGMKAAMGAVGALLNAAPEVQHLTPVAAKGLDL